MVVMGSSLGASTDMWDPQIEALSRELRILRFDLPGHGGSAQPQEPFSIGDVATAVLALLDRLEVETAGYCGLSIGGAIGMTLAASASDRIERLALCCTAASFPPAEMWGERARTVREQGVEAVADATMERWFTAGFRQREADTVARIRETLAGTPREAYALHCEALGEFDASHSLASITAPTLILVGSEDPGVTPERGEELRNGIPDSRLVVVDDAAHLANVEQPRAVGAALATHFTAA